MEYCHRETQHRLMSPSSVSDGEICFTHPSLVTHNTAWSIILNYIWQLYSGSGFSYKRECDSEVYFSFTFTCDLVSQLRQKSACLSRLRQHVLSVLRQHVSIVILFFFYVRSLSATSSTMSILISATSTEVSIHSISVTSAEVSMFVSATSTEVNMCFLCYVSRSASLFFFFQISRSHLCYVNMSSTLSLQLQFPVFLVFLSSIHERYSCCLFICLCLFDLSLSYLQANFP